MGRSFYAAYFFLIVAQYASCAVLEGIFNEASEVECEQNFSSNELRKSCSEGCRLFTVIALAKSSRDVNETTKLCDSACLEAFNNNSEAKACNYGCNACAAAKSNEETVQTLHLLTPFIYMKSAYNSMAHHVKQFISTSWTVYVQQDSGKMVVLQSSPKIIESLEYSMSRDEDDSGEVRNYQQEWQDKRNWMDCISRQSGIPRWLLVAVLCGFIVALLWLCCATAVTAPNQYVSSPKPKKDMGYILLCEPTSDMKVPLLETQVLDCSSEQAPPLPTKPSLI